MTTVPQYKVNVHVARLLSLMGLPSKAEETFRARGTPDFIIIHPIMGQMLGEAEIGSDETDPNARIKLEKRTEERFRLIAFKGFDSLMLIIYPRRSVELLSSVASEAEIDRLLLNMTVGLGLAVRGDAYGLSSHYISWYNTPVTIANIPLMLDHLVEGFFRELRGINKEMRENANEAVQSILTAIENAAGLLKNLYVDEELNAKLADIAKKLNIAWDQIVELKDRIYITSKFLLLLSSLLILFYEIIRNERKVNIPPIDCNNISFPQLADVFKDYVIKKYEELDEDFINVLYQVPQNQILLNAIKCICREIRNNYPTLRIMGWDALAMMYQRLLSETYRHAFATFYTKIPAARLLASLAVEKFEDRVIDPACGTGSLLLSALERRISMLGYDTLLGMYKSSLMHDQPILDIANELVLSRTVGLDALKPAAFMTSLILRIATKGSPPNRLNIFSVLVGPYQGGSLNILIPELKESIPCEVDKRYDIVIMNPPFTRNDRIPFLIGEQFRRNLSSRKLFFGGVEVSDIFVAGMAKPFMILADRLLEENGKIAAVLPNSILSRVSWRDIRTGLLKNYNIEYIVISWAPGSPNFSSDTRFREILLVARKGAKPGLMKIINLYKRPEDLKPNEIERISIEARRIEEKGVAKYVSDGQNSIASLLSVDLEALIKQDLADNLYRLIAFKNGEILKLHMDIVSGSIKFNNLFKVGSAIVTTKGLTRCYHRDEAPTLRRESPAIWGSGDELGIKRPRIGRAPYKIGVENEAEVRICYWNPGRRQTFYSGKLFIPRKIRISTQYILMIHVDEDSITNVWYPIAPRDDSVDKNVITRYLIYMNSIFGFIHLLGERLETEGLYVEYKKKHWEKMPIPDLRKVPYNPYEDVIKVLEDEMPRFDHYIRKMAERNKGKRWLDAIKDLIEEAKTDESLRPYANRALLDLEAYTMLLSIYRDIRVPENLYVLLQDEIDVLSQIMEHDDEEDEIKDIADIVEEKIKYKPLDEFF